MQELCHELTQGFTSLSQHDVRRALKLCSLHNRFGDLLSSFLLTLGISHVPHTFILWTLTIFLPKFLQGHGFLVSTSTDQPNDCSSINRRRILLILVRVLFSPLLASYVCLGKTEESPYTSSSTVRRGGGVIQKQTSIRTCVRAWCSSEHLSVACSRDFLLI